MINKTRYAILGLLAEEPRSGYEIKSFMARSTVYFWRESDSTIYPMLKLLAKEGKILSETAFVGKKKKEIFSITPAGVEELKAWRISPTGSETPRNEFLLKLFFAADNGEMSRLCRERLGKVQSHHDEYKKIEERLPDGIRLKALRYGIALLELEIEWLKEAS